MSTKEERLTYYRAWRATPKGKESKKLSRKRYNTSPRGKALRKAAHEAFHSTPERKAIDKLVRKAYSISPKGKVSGETYRSTPKGRFTTYKGSARNKGLPFELTLEDHFTPGAPNTFWQKPCTYCNDKIETIGLDRIDNDKGYTIDNVVSCCGDCNLTRGNRWTYEEMETIIGPAIANVKNLRARLI